MWAKRLFLFVIVVSLVGISITSKSANAAGWGGFFDGIQIFPYMKEFNDVMDNKQGADGIMANFYMGYVAGVIDTIGILALLSPEAREDMLLNVKNSQYSNLNLGNACSITSKFLIKNTNMLEGQASLLVIMGVYPPK